MEDQEQKSITLKIHDDKLQKACSITLNLGDKYRASDGFVWKCFSIGFGHITFIQDIIIEHHWTTPHFERGTQHYILTYERTKMFLTCPVRNWVKTTEPTRTIVDNGRTFHMNG